VLDATRSPPAAQLKEVVAMLARLALLLQFSGFALLLAHSLGAGAEAWPGYTAILLAVLLSTLRKR
jgi:hypothetical protein